MEANRKRNIRSGEEYSHLFPKAEGSTATIRKNADVTHTVAFIPKVVNETLHHTKQLAQRLKGITTYETCSNIWHFVYQHIAYKKDQEGYEQIRSPARAWHDRKKGVDCDCYSVFISSILTNCKIPHILRITKYHRDYFQHIYPVVPFNGKFITLDCVTDQYNYEVPYSEKKDYPMDLQYLNGFDGDLMGELGKVKAKKAAKKSLPAAKKTSLLTKLKAKKAAKPKPPPGAVKPKKKGFFKKVLNTVNRINPATVLLRNGVLAAMKLNVKNVAGRLRWSYLTPEQAAQKNIDPQKFQRLVAAREKLEKIFYGAGGNPKNLKKAMLGGKGNKDKAVAVLDGISFAGVEYLSAYTPLPQLLGREIYYSENVEGFEGLGELGEPITLATVGAAMGVISGVVAALKQIGNIFNGGGEGSKDFDEGTNEAAENNVPVPGTTPVPLPEAGGPSTSLPIEKPTIEESFKKTDNSGISNNALVKSETDSYSTATNPHVPATISEEVNETSENLPVQTTATTEIANTNTTPPPTPKESFWDKNKTWLKPVAIGVGGVSLIAIGFAVLKPKKGASNHSSSKPLSGLPKYKKKKSTHHRKKKTHKSKPSKKTAVALL
ncbi:MAG: hypothetical protein EOO10_12700 [Chitinophagaceae bacterium]|nr:MAG: hypothetical protein EOO10_12700 [Chitinophagaceae bacterium]